MQYPKDGVVFSNSGYQTATCKEHLLESITDTRGKKENIVDLTGKNLTVKRNQECKRYFSTVTCDIEIQSGKICTQFLIH